MYACAGCLSVTLWANHNISLLTLVYDSNFKPLLE